MKKEKLILIMKALGDETRLKIFKMLAEKPLCGYHILDKLDITQPTLSYHMQILCKCGLVKCEKDWKWSYYSQNKALYKEFILAIENL
jgi:ArsR family transcriptional regulator